MHTVIHRSKVDGWLRSLFRCSQAVTLVACTAILFAACRARDLAAMILVFLLGAALPWWVLRSTDYTIASDALTVRFGPFRWKIALADIQRVEPTTSPLSGPALSLDRLRIEYGKGRVMLVSPEDTERFLADLRARGARADGPYPAGEG